MPSYPRFLVPPALVPAALVRPSALAVRVQTVRSGRQLRRPANAGQRSASAGISSSGNGSAISA
ncbi:MAG TPA: hypothetical protein VIJ60_12750, partial [Acidimicrobiales bacterium]